MAETNSCTLPSTAPTTRRSTKKPHLWNVVLLDDDVHTYEYVIKMLTALFGHTLQGAFRAAQHVDEHGRVIVYTAHRELAELKREQIKGFGRDPYVAECTGPMSAILMPVAGDGDA